MYDVCKAAPLLCIWIYICNDAQASLPARIKQTQVTIAYRMLQSPEVPSGPPATAGEVCALSNAMSLSVNDQSNSSRFSLR